MRELPPNRTKPARGSLLDSVEAAGVSADAPAPSLLDAALRPKRTPRLDVGAYAPRSRPDPVEEPAPQRAAYGRERQEGWDDHRLPPLTTRATRERQTRYAEEQRDDWRAESRDEDAYADDGAAGRKPSWFGRLSARFSSQDREDERAAEAERRPVMPERRATQAATDRRATQAATERRQSSPMPDETPTVEAPAASADRPLVDLRVVISSVWKLRYVILATTVLGAIGGVMLAVATPNKYVATSKLYVDPREVRLTDSDLSKQSLATEGILALVDSQLEVLRSRGVLEKVVTDLGLERDPEFGATGSGLLGKLTGQSSAPAPSSSAVANRSLDALAKAIAVGRDPKTFIITVDVASRDPAKSALIANRLVDTFLAEEQSAQSAFYRRTTEALDARLEELRKELDTAENAVEDFKATNDIVGANGQLISEKELFSLNDQVSAARSRIADAKAKVEVASRVSPSAVIGGNFPEEVNSLTLTELRKQYASAKTSLGALEANLGPRHPQRLAAAQSVETARNEIANELNRIAANARAELARAEQAERDLVNQLNTQKNRQITASSSYVELRELERTASATRAIYESFMKRARETSEEQKLSDRNIRVISKAEPPLQPVGPSRKLIAIAGVIGGLFLGIGIGILLGVVRSIRPLFDPATPGGRRSERRAAPDRARHRDPTPRDRAEREPYHPRDAYARQSAPPETREERTPSHRRTTAPYRDDLHREDEATHWRNRDGRDRDPRDAYARDLHPRDPYARDWQDDPRDPYRADTRRFDRPAPQAVASQDAVEALMAARRIVEAERQREDAAYRTGARQNEPLDGVEDGMRALRHRVEAFVRRKAGGRG